MIEPLPQNLVTALEVEQEADAPPQIVVPQKIHRQAVVKKPRLARVAVAALVAAIGLGAFVHYYGGSYSFSSTVVQNPSPAPAQTAAVPQSWFPPETATTTVQ